MKKSPLLLPLLRRPLLAELPPNSPLPRGCSASSSSPCRLRLCLQQETSRRSSCATEATATASTETRPPPRCSGRRRLCSAARPSSSGEEESERAPTGLQQEPGKRRHCCSRRSAAAAAAVAAAAAPFCSAVARALGPLCLFALWRRRRRRSGLWKQRCCRCCFFPSLRKIRKRPRAPAPHGPARGAPVPLALNCGGQAQARAAAGARHRGGRGAAAAAAAAAAIRCCCFPSPRPHRPGQRLWPLAAAEALSVRGRRETFERERKRYFFEVSFFSFVFSVFSSVLNFLINNNSFFASSLPFSSTDRAHRPGPRPSLDPCPNHGCSGSDRQEQALLFLLLLLLPPPLPHAAARRLRSLVRSSKRPPWRGKR